MTRPWSVGAAAVVRRLGHGDERGRASGRRGAFLALDDVLDDVDVDVGGGQTEKGTEAAKESRFFFFCERAERAATLHIKGAVTVRWQLAHEYGTMRRDAVIVCSGRHRPLSPLLRGTRAVRSAQRLLSSVSCTCASEKYFIFYKTIATACI